MSDYDFILDGITYSFSSIGTYDNCPYCFKLSYIDIEDGRVDNAFGEFGLLMHDCLEKYLKKEVDAWDLPIYYEENYYNFVKTPFPPYPVGMGERYYQDGLSFVEGFDFNVDDYEIINIEGFVKHAYRGIDLVIKPDAVLKHKETGEISLVDFKTSRLYNNSRDTKKVNGYLKQLHFYAYILWLKESIEIDKIVIWYIRNQEIREYPVDQDKILETMDWIEDTVGKIKREKEWNPNKSKENKYFCDHICSYRAICARKFEEEDV